MCTAYTENYPKNTYPIFILRLLGRRTKRHKLPRNDPVQITMLNRLIVPVRLHIECLVVEPAEFDGVAEAADTVEDGAFVAAVALAGVSEVDEFYVFEWFEGLLRGAAEDRDLEGRWQGVPGRRRLGMRRWRSLLGSYSCSGKA